MSWGRVDDAMATASFPCSETIQDTTEMLREYRNGDYVFPGAVLLVGHSGEIVYHRAFGSRSLMPKNTVLEKHMVFDVASLTKAMVTTTLAMQMVDNGQLSLDRKLSHIFQTFGTLGKERITIRHLLSHCSGYPDTHPYYRLIAKADEGDRVGVMTSRVATEMVYNEIFRAKLENLPGKVCKYSDVGFILLGHALEVLNGGQTLDRLAVQRIFAPLELAATGFIELSKLKRGGLEPISEQIVPTVDCPWRRRVLCGEVHDDNAWAMGGVAAHAGVFSNAEDVHAFAAELIECWHGRGELVTQDVLKRFWQRDDTVPGSTWALGWDTPSEKDSSSGHFFSRSSVGHLGYTGCSLWIDPEREVDVVLLSNRIHPNSDNILIKKFRPIVHDLVLSALNYGD